MKSVAEALWINGRGGGAAAADARTRVAAINIIVIASYWYA